MSDAVTTDLTPNGACVRLRLKRMCWVLNSNCDGHRRAHTQALSESIPPRVSVQWLVRLSGRDPAAREVRPVAFRRWREDGAGRSNDFFRLRKRSRMSLSICWLRVRRAAQSPDRSNLL